MTTRSTSNPYLPPTLRGDTRAERHRTISAPPRQQESAPVGTTAEVLGWVGRDAGRAAVALDQELSRKRPRVTLVAALESVLETPGAAPAKTSVVGMDQLRERLGLLR